MHIVYILFINIYIHKYIHTHAHKGTHSPFDGKGLCLKSKREKEEKNRLFMFKIFGEILLYLMS